MWDLRQRKCIRDYGGNDGDVPAVEWGLFHYDSIWTVEPTSTFESCFTGGRDGQIYHTDLVGDTHTLLYQGNKNPITSLSFDEQNNQLWFTCHKDSSLRCLDLQKRSLDKIGAKNGKDALGVGDDMTNEDINLEQPDYELQGLAQITEYHILNNKRYIITNNSAGVSQLWNIDQCKLVKSYQAKSFNQVKHMMESKYDLGPENTPYPYSWFSVDIKLGCLTIHLNEDNW